MYSISNVMQIYAIGEGIIKPLLLNKWYYPVNISGEESVEMVWYSSICRCRCLQPEINRVDEMNE